MQEVSHFKCKYIDKKDIWQFAEEFRSKYWQENILPVDIESIVEKRLKQGLSRVIKNTIFTRMNIQSIYYSSMGHVT